VNHNVNKLMEYSIAKTIASFMNVEGGKLFIGINDDGEVLGLNSDYETLHKKNKDGFLLQLTQVINQYIGKEFHQYVSYEIVKIDDKDMCVVSVGNSDSPAYIKTRDKEEFFIRASASSQPMSIRESNEYIKAHWDNQN
jgi:predicted HTH transcriptional regulator